MSIHHRDTDTQSGDAWLLGTARIRKTRVSPYFDFGYNHEQTNNRIVTTNYKSAYQIESK